jgi:hypothetical protein
MRHTYSSISSSPIRQEAVWAVVPTINGLIGRGKKSNLFNFDCDLAALLVGQKSNLSIFGLGRALWLVEKNPTSRIFESAVALVTMATLKKCRLHVMSASCKQTPEEKKENVRKISSTQITMEGTSDILSRVCIVCSSILVYSGAMV